MYPIILLTVAEAKMTDISDNGDQQKVGGNIGPGAVVGNGQVKAENIAGRDINQITVNINDKSSPYASLDFSPAALGEILLVIAQFKGQASNLIDVQNHIRNRLDHSLASYLENGSVRIANTVFVVESSEQACKLLLASQSHAVIWGWQDQIALTCHLDVAKDTKQVESLRQVYERCATIDDFEQFRFSVVREAPTRLSFVAQLLVSYLWYWKKDYRQAAVAFERCLQSASDEAICEFNRWLVYYYLGYSLVQLKRWTAAVGAFTRAIELNPQHVRSLINRGLAYHCLENVTAAEADYRAAVDLEPGAADAYYNWACLAATQGNNQEALRLLEKSIAFDASQSEAAREDPDFEPLYDEPAFRSLVSRG
jgi:tetratricopeptide (TPR) repeat protein